MRMCFAARGVLRSSVWGRCAAYRWRCRRCGGCSACGITAGKLGQYFLGLISLQVAVEEVQRLQRFGVTAGELDRYFL